MLRQFLMGAAVSICNITIHALAMTAVIYVAQVANELTRKIGSSEQPLNSSIAVSISR
jgi:hypothetical protein